MIQGTIKTLNPDKGFGFIIGGDGTEYFFHRSAVEGRVFDELQEGQAVEFAAEEVAPKGPRAKTVKPMRAAAQLPEAS